MVEVTVSRLGRDSSTNAYVVILREKGGSRLLPIWIGQPEAESIAMEINQIKRERPVTHDLCRNIILALGGTLRRVQITKVQKSTYYAELLVQHADGLKSIDARPSDSIAIALPGNNETSDDIANSYGEILTYGLKDDYWNTFVGDLTALTPADVNASASKLVKPDALTWVVVGDLSKIEKPVRALDFGEVTILDADGKVVSK